MLGRQLAQLRANQPQQPQQRGKPSLLFDPVQAAALDTNTIYSLGYEGWTDLCKQDGRFVQFEAALFSEDAKRFERELHTRKENDALDQTLQHFLQLLSPFFLLRPAHKALEWLIRRFK